MDDENQPNTGEPFKLNCTEQTDSNSPVQWNCQDHQAPDIDIF